LDSYEDDRLITDVFDPEGTGDYGAGEMNCQDLVVFIKKLHAEFEATGHFLSNVMIDVDGDMASSKSYVTAWHWRNATAHLGRARPADFVAVLVYHDEFKRTACGWRIFRRRIHPIAGAVAIGSMTG
jgi:hypothetical protein